MARKSSTTKTTQPANNSSTYLEKLENEIQGNQSRLSLVLGALIVLVLGFLVFNYFNKNKADLGPAQTMEQLTEDVSPDKLPGKYSVKEGDTLFTIAQNYYQDGYKFSEIAKANNLSNVDSLEIGQVLEIPKLETVAAAETQPETPVSPNTDYGQKIDGKTYTVAEGDWLSTIAARAYGDPLSYTKIAQANNITNPDYITPGMTLNLPR